jgi:L-cystine transport system substrate-binding protein
MRQGANAPAPNGSGRPGNPLFSLGILNPFCLGGIPMKKLFSLILVLVLSLSAAAALADVKTVNVGTEGVYSPFTFVDESGKLTGYDVEVIRLVDELLPDYEFNFVQTAWDGIFLALDAGKIDMIANNLGKNPEREEKYLFNEVPYLYNYNTVVTAADVTDIKSLEDFAGKRIGSSVGSNYTNILEKYTAEHGNPFEITYYDGNYSFVLQDLVAGRLDATFNSPFATADIAKTLGITDKIKAAGVVGDADPIHLLFRKDGAELAAAMDGALKQLVESGKLAELSVQWFGEDYSAPAKG